MGRPSPRWALLAGAFFALGALIAAPLSGAQIGGFGLARPGQVSWLELFAGTFIVGSLFWWLLVARRHRLSLRRGAVTGVAVGLSAYPAVIGLAEIFRRHPDGLGQSIGERFLYVLQVSGLAIVTTGFATTIVMALVGLMAALVLRPLYPEPRRRERSSLARKVWRALTVAAGAIVLLLVGGFVWLTLLPLDEEGFARARAPLAPAASYGEAMARFEAIRAEEAARPLNPRCLTKLLTHGDKVARVVVFFHGLTNCPAQLDKLAPLLFAEGYNVYVPLLPGHGEADPMTTALVDLTAEGMAGAADRAIDLARGLGDEVYVAGLSGGGTMTMWAAQNREEVAHAIALAPFLGPFVVPTWANRAATNLLLLLPSLMFTWDPLEPMGPPGMEYAYPRVPTHALGQFMRLGEIVLDSARRSPPVAQGLGVLVSEADFAVNNRLALEVAAEWEAHGKPVDVEIISLSKGIIHDMIDPRQPDQNTDFVYALFLDMIRRHSAGTK